MPLTANFIADFSSFITACRDATTSTEELVEAAGKVGADVDQMIAQTAGGIKNAAVAIGDFAKTTFTVLTSSQVKDFVSDVTFAVSGFIKEFEEGEVATSRLTVALRDAGQASPAVIAAYGEMATQLQHVSRFSDEAITDAQTIFTTIGQVGPENMRLVLEATMNLARGMNMELVPAAKLVAQAAQSDGESLGKLHKIFGDAIPEGAKFSEVLEAINEKFGGQYQADLETTTGKLANLKNQMSDINEQIGAALAENLKTVLGLFTALPEGMQTFIIAAVAIGAALAPILISLSSVVTLLGASGLMGALGAAGAAIVPFLPLIAAIAAAVLAVWAVWHYWDDMVALVKKAVDYLKIYLGDVLPAAFRATIDTVKQWYSDIKLWLYDKLAWLIGEVVKLPGKVTAAFGEMYDAIIGHSYVPDLMNGIARHFASLNYIMVNPALAAAQVVYGAFAPLGDPIKIAAASIGGGGAAGGEAAWGGGGGGGGATTVNVTVNMSGMLSADDPQTRAAVADLVSDAVMQGMRGTRRLGTV
jgi:hypothetical protein